MRISFLFLSIFLLAGCSTELYVKDINSNPIEGANVVVTRFSLSSDPAIKTNKDGMVKISFAMPDIEFISVSKNGYLEVTLSSDKLKMKPYIFVLKRKTETISDTKDLFHNQENILKIR